MSHHTHRPVAALSRAIGWNHCVAKIGSNCSGAAHGGVVWVEECKCGALRRTESNGRHSMRGAWVLESERLRERADAAYFAGSKDAAATLRGLAEEAERKERSFR